jgi:site-specific DNA recombinase
MATFYREQVAALHVALGDEHGEGRDAAAERLRTLVDKIILTPVDGKLAIDVHGDLGGILAIAHEKASRAEKEDASQGSAALETRSRFNSPKNKGRTLTGAAFAAELAKQVKLVAGAGFEPTTFRL